MRRIVWIVPMLLVFIGLGVVLFAYLQPSQTATVEEATEIYYTPSRRMVRGKTSTHYRAILQVVIDGANEEPIEVEYLTIHPNEIPKAGEQIQVSHGLKGMVTHPNRTLVGIGGAVATIGGLFLFLLLLTWLSLRRKGEA